MLSHESMASREPAAKISSNIQGVDCSMENKNGVILFLVGSLLLLVFSFQQPFVSNDFEVKLTKKHYANLLRKIVSKRKRFRSRIGKWFVGKATNRVIKKLTPGNVRRLNRTLKVYAITEGGIKVGDYYLWGTIKDLWRSKEHFISLAIFLFSIVFPIAKIVVMASALSSDVSLTLRENRMKAVKAISKWSMGDVFIVALMIVMFKATSFNYVFKAEPGIFCYAGSFFFSWIAAAKLTVALEKDGRRAKKGMGVGPLNNNHKWGTKNTGRKHRLIGWSFSEVKSGIARFWKKSNWRITELVFDGRKYTVVMDDSTGYSSQSYQYGTLDEVRGFIAEKWKSGYSITTWAHDGDRHIVVMSKNCHAGHQKYFIRERHGLAKEKIFQLYPENYFVTSYVWDGRNYVVTMTKEVPNWEDQVVEEAWTESEYLKKIRACSHWYITSEFHDGHKHVMVLNSESSRCDAV